MILNSHDRFVWETDPKSLFTLKWSFLPSIVSKLCLYQKVLKHETYRFSAIINFLCVMHLIFKGLTVFLHFSLLKRITSWSSLIYWFVHFGLFNSILFYFINPYRWLYPLCHYNIITGTCYTRRQGTYAGQIMDICLDQILLYMQCYSICSATVQS